jgi:hypothetical protein
MPGAESPGNLDALGDRESLVLLRIGTGNVPDAETEPRVRLRMRRQQILHRDFPPRLWAVIDEAALRRPIGGAAVMRT